MPVIIQGENLPVTAEEAQRLWTETIAATAHGDDEVVVRGVDEEESRRLNLEYRKKDAPTNVLTFSYPAGSEGVSHDIALCLPVAEKEAGERGVESRDYVALLLVHAFLHAVGMDHERSAEAAAAQQEAEVAILTKAGWSAQAL